MAALACIATSMPNLTVIHRLCENIFSRNPLSKLDDQKISPNTACGFIAVLGQLGDQPVNPSHTIKNLGRLGRHASVTFMYMGEPVDVMLIRIYSDLEVSETGERKIYIISGNLEQWQKAVVDFAREDNSIIELKAFACIALQQFDELGMGQMFDGYSRKSTRQGLILTKK